MKKIIPFDDYNCHIGVGTDIAGAVTTTWGHKALRNGWKLIEKDMAKKRIAVNALEGGAVCRTLLATYHKIGVYNVSDHSFPAVGEIEESINDKDMAKRYRIRKLTTRECFRLMDVRDEDIDKIKATGVSESQQYKLAGNSIVVAVLEGIFTQMFRADTDALF